MALPTDTSSRAIQAPSAHALSGLTVNGLAPSQRFALGSGFVALDWPRSANGTSGTVSIVLSGDAPWYWAEGVAMPANTNNALLTPANIERAIAVSGMDVNARIWIAGPANIQWYIVRA